MKTKRALLAAVLALLLCLTALPAAYAEGGEEVDYSTLYMYGAADLNTTLYIATEWQPLAVEPRNAIFPDEETVYAEDGSIQTSFMIFTCLADTAEVDAAESYADAQIAARKTGVGIAGVVGYPENGKPEDAGLIGYSYREFASFDGFKVAVAWADASAYANANADDIPMLDALVASYRDTDKYLVIDTPLDSFGHFHATDLDGAETSYELFADAKLTLVNVWATFCSPCLEEMPDLGELAAEYADKGVQIIGIPVDIFAADGSVDQNQLALAKQIVEKTKANYPHLIADEELMASPISKAQYVPSSWFVDSEGNIVGSILVGSMSKADWQAEIEKHLTMAE